MQKKVQCDLCASRSLATIYNLNDLIIQQCQKCDLVFREALLDKEEATGLYSEDYFTVEQDDYFFKNSDLKHKIFQGRMKRIEALRPSRGRLLDIGCAIGTSLVVARNRGWQTKGVEVSSFAARYARDKNSLDVDTGSIEEQNYEAESFDVITLWDVIDHIEEPQKFIEHLHSLVKPNGLLVVQTNMEDSLLYRIAHYLYILSFGAIKKPVTRCHPVHHTTFYSTSTIKKALEKAGFKVIKEEPDDLDSDLINTNSLGKVLLRLIAQFARIINRPLESTFYARK